MGRRKRSVDELKPCPFCGGRASLDVMPHKGSEWAAAECTACGASTDVYKNAESAIESWNTRWGMNEFELLPCPFCGNTEGFQVKTVWKTYRFVACRCKAAGPVMPDDETAVEAWNTRVESGGGFDAPRYRRICGALESALQELTEWGCAE